MCFFFFLICNFLTLTGLVSVSFHFTRVNRDNEIYEINEIKNNCCLCKLK